MTLLKVRQRILEVEITYYNKVVRGSLVKKRISKEIVDKRG